MNPVRLRLRRKLTPVPHLAPLLPGRAKRKHHPKGKRPLSADSAHPSSTRSAMTRPSAAPARQLLAHRGEEVAKASLERVVSVEVVNLQRPPQRRLMLLRLHRLVRASPSRLDSLSAPIPRRPHCPPLCCPHLALWRRMMTMTPHHRSGSRTKRQPRLCTAFPAVPRGNSRCQATFPRVPIAPSPTSARVHPRLVKLVATVLRAPPAEVQHLTWRTAQC